MTEIPEENELETRIREVFSSSTSPQTIAMPSSDDDIGQEVSNFFLNKPWNTLRLVHLETWGIALSYFTAPAYAYFLPSFMIASIHDRKHQTDLPERTVWSLGEPEAYWQEISEERLSLFDSPRIQLCIDFITCMHRRFGVFQGEGDYLEAYSQKRWPLP